MVTLVTTYIAPKTKIGLPYLNQLGLFHSSLRTKDDQTERYLAALRNPHLQVPWQLEFIELGLAAALKAKIPAKRIVNFMSLGELRLWVARAR